MFASKSFCFYLFLIFVAVPGQVVSSTQMNKSTASDGKEFITGEVVVSTARYTKIALAEIKTKLQSLSAKDEKFSEYIERKLDLMNKSNAALSMQVQAMSQRLTTLERQGANYDLLFPRKGTSDYVITRSMPSLTAVTVCFWMKTTDTGNEGTPLSYAESGSSGRDELVLFDYRDFSLWVGGRGRYKHSLAT
ncbi:biological adhesion [Desmophyllum pertusum]|uniref:Biological adhesion n=1 Tax=Desmophyllum pertusum TaxID=174260 RepID=A0A9X0D1V5_9CNID|nr:biological adhesion [Desmophyllum pertusum]